MTKLQACILNLAGIQRKSATQNPPSDSTPATNNNRNRCKGDFLDHFRTLPTNASLSANPICLLLHTLPLAFVESRSFPVPAHFDA